MRGEYQPRAITGWDLWELPPRARRIHRHPNPVHPRFGTTSACAENTCFPQRTDTLHRNYLRVRGEYLQERMEDATMLELPPRARRIQTLSYRTARTLRTTSACAENTPIAFQIKPRLWNYLRVRGEYAGPALIAHAQGELPPRARRIRPLIGRNRCGLGTTSACAENTNAPYQGEELNRNYLRVRGEYKPGVFSYAPIMELPPRARRIRGKPVACNSSHRTTSACAENTNPSTWLPALKRNYLRVRGEYRGLEAK